MPQSTLAWVKATILGASLSGTIACGGGQPDQVAPTCGPCCHGGGPECVEPARETVGAEEVDEEVADEEVADEEVVDEEVVDEEIDAQEEADQAPTCGPSCH